MRIKQDRYQKMLEALKASDETVYSNKAVIFPGVAGSIHAPYLVGSDDESTPHSLRFL